MSVLGYQVADALTWTHIAGFCVLFILAAYVIDFLTLAQSPKGIPSFSVGNGFIAHVRNSFAYLTRHRAWMNDGHAEVRSPSKPPTSSSPVDSQRATQYGSKGLPFALPAFLSEPVEVVLPRSMIGWLIEQPESVVSSKVALDRIIFSHYNFLSPRLMREDVVNRILTKFLPRHLAALIPVIDVEVQKAVARALRRVDENEWARVNVWDLWLDIVPQATNRILVGEELCRDQAFLDSMVAFTNAVNRNSLILRMFPRVLQPILGRLLVIPNWLHWRSAHKKLAPIIERRLAEMKEDTSSSSSSSSPPPPPPEDVITWIIRLAKREDMPWLLDASTISTCILPFEFASIHTTVLTGQGWMLDLLSLPPDEVSSAIDALTREIKDQAPPPGVPWTKAGLQSLHRLDSSVRESQRLGSFTDNLVHRAVVAPEGLRHPDFGWTIPKGVVITANVESTHHDRALYGDPLVYQPFRYARMREEGAEDEEKKKKSAGADVEEKGTATSVVTTLNTSNTNTNNTNPLTLGMVSTSSHHLAFGHGRHACPGRFFAAHELKLILAQLLVEYEFRPMAEKPRPTWVGSNAIPPLSACVEMRRKGKKASPSSSLSLSASWTEL